MSQPFSVYLRKPRSDDKEALVAAYERSSGLHQPFTFAPENIDTYINQANRYLACIKETHVIVGTLNISNIVRGWFQSAYLGYEVFAPYQQRGLMYQGLLLLIDEAFTKLNLHRLEANIQPDNIASIKLVEKAGFIKEGYSKNYLRVGGKEWKDHERWAIVNSHWQGQDSAGI
ncbi:MAG: GNAT family N-acetyltransferase [Gammaproteobacteria bacterium]|nr:MAG: GNAT family N-acetyltransferase [Gammaproteobacteria bacterium]